MFSDVGPLGHSHTHTQATGNLPEEESEERGESPRECRGQRSAHDYVAIHSPYQLKSVMFVTV